jgi:hypothetical protein
MKTHFLRWAAALVVATPFASLAQKLNLIVGIIYPKLLNQVSEKILSIFRN